MAWSSSFEYLSSRAINGMLFAVSRAILFIVGAGGGWLLLEVDDWVDLIVLLLLLRLLMGNKVFITISVARGDVFIVFDICINYEHFNIMRIQSWSMLEYFRILQVLFRRFGIIFQRIVVFIIWEIEVIWVVFHQRRRRIPFLILFFLIFIIFLLLLERISPLKIIFVLKCTFSSLISLLVYLLSDQFIEAFG